MAKNKTTVIIDGQEYTLAGEEPAGYMHEVALLVDEKMVEIRQKCDYLSTAMTAVLAAVNIADELIKERAKNAEYEEKADEEKQPPPVFPPKVKTLGRS